jgi:hypothetical protein
MDIDEVIFDEVIFDEVIFDEVSNSRSRCTQDYVRDGSYRPL